WIRVDLTSAIFDCIPVDQAAVACVADDDAETFVFLERVFQQPARLDLAGEIERHGYTRSSKLSPSAPAGNSFRPYDGRKRPPGRGESGKGLPRKFLGREALTVARKDGAPGRAPRPMPDITGHRPAIVVDGTDIKGLLCHWLSSGRTKPPRSRGAAESRRACRASPSGCRGLGDRSGRSGGDLLGSRRRGYLLGQNGVRRHFHHSEASKRRNLHGCRTTCHFQKRRKVPRRRCEKRQLVP